MLTTSGSEARFTTPENGARSERDSVRADGWDGGGLDRGRRCPSDSETLLWKTCFSGRTMEVGGVRRAGAARTPAELLAGHGTGGCRIASAAAALALLPNPPPKHLWGGERAAAAKITLETRHLMEEHRGQVSLAAGSVVPQDGDGAHGTGNFLLYFFSFPHQLKRWRFNRKNAAFSSP